MIVRDKLTDQQVADALFEIDWSKAPSGAEEAVLELHWLDRNGDKFAWNLFGYFERHKGETMRIFNEWMDSKRLSRNQHIDA